ncbi:MAG: hypothetical protein ACTSQA_05420 [Candidatus Heimdallarchaeaceae archaeon]
MSPTNVFLAYDHNKNEFSEIKEQIKFQKIMESDASDISSQLMSMDVDGVLIFNRDKNEWHLIFSKQVGLVAQRTGRRIADNISRAGFQLLTGERVGAKSRLEQLTEDNIGDLNLTVQEKYIETDLSGFRGDSRQDTYPKQVFSKVEKPVEEPKPQVIPEQKLGPPTEYPADIEPAVIEPVTGPVVETEPEPEPELEPQTLVVSEPEPVEDVVAEPVEDVVDEPVEDVVDEPVEDVVDEPVEDVVDEPVEDVVDEPCRRCC